MRPSAASCSCVVMLAMGLAVVSMDGQPRVQPGPSEPDWIALLDRVYHLDMTADLINPVTTSPEQVRSLFRKAGEGPVVFTPILALGLEVPIHGGFYLAEEFDRETELWSYQAKSTAKQIERGDELTPPLRESSATEFDPGSSVFGFWIGNDQFNDRVYTEPSRVRKKSPRLATQPYKVMIYPFMDPKTGQKVPHSYLMGWEYSTNDDFQDVVCRVDNVILID